MKFGTDFFKVLAFVMQVLRLFARVFGDKDDQKADDEVSDNHIHELNKMRGV